MLKKKIFYFISLVLVLTFFNSVFFYYYYTKADLVFSSATVCFIFLFLTNFVLILHILRNIYLKIIYLFSFFVYILYFLVNFAYYDVFRVFWKISFKQLGQMNNSQLNLIRSYYDLIPSEIYISAAALLSLTLICLGLYIWKKRVINKRIKELVNQVDFLVNSPRVRPTSIPVLLLVIIAVNACAFFFLASYKAQAGVKDFKKSQYYAGLGVYGFLFDNLSSSLKQTTTGFVQKSVASDTKNPNDFSDLDSIKNDLQGFISLSNMESQTGIRLKNKLDKPHIIIYQMESVGAWALKQEPSPMPFLSKLIKDNLSIDHFFSNSCMTINADFSANCSFYPESSGPISDLFSRNNYYCLPSILKDKYGYTTSMYHANEISFWNRGTLVPKWGFTNLYFSPHYKIRAGDYEILDDVVNKIKNATGPTYNYVIGFTTHGPHDQSFIELNHYENNLDIQPYQSPLNANSLKVDTDSETINNYFGFLTAADNGLKNLFDKLADNELLDKTIVIVYGDHRYYSFSSGNEVDNFYNYNEIPFVMYVPGGYQGEIKAIASQIDIAPTLLNIIGGDNYELPPYFVGHSLFSDKHPDSAISKCLGEAVYVSADLIIKNEKSLGISQPIIFNHKYAQLKYLDYLKYFLEIIDKSDRVIIDNKISATRFTPPAAATSSIDKSGEVDLNQTTDSDRDGLSDLREKTIGTDYLDPDTDDDGYRDGVEVINNHNPLGRGISSQEP